MTEPYDPATDPAADLIARAEREAGVLWDDERGGAHAILFGALAREMGMSRFGPRDDFAVGTLIVDEMRNGDRRRASGAALLALLGLGLSPDDIHKLNGGR